ncbi:MAG: ATP-binding protein [Gammaproteobacteria bacterium]|nr:ATP-binding protein [Gammaproteobacteria bacterium]
MKLRTRISLAIAILALVFGASLGTLLQNESETLMYEEHQQWGAALTKALSSAILKDTIQGRTRNIKETLNRVLKDNPNLSYLLVVDFDGEIISSTFGQVPQNILSQLSRSKKTLTVTVNGEQITDIRFPLVKNLNASLHIGIKHENFQHAIVKMQGNFIIIVSILIVLAIIAGILFSRRLSKPIECLSTSIKAFGQGQEPEDIDMTHADLEVRNLYTDFQTMALQRIKHEKELKLYRDELETLVKQRTAALEDEIAKHKETEKSLIAAKEDAEKANNAKSDFLSQMSHEFRTPLNAILGFSQLMELENNLPLNVHKNVDIIKNSGEHLLQLVNEILDLAKIEAGKLEISMEPVSWNEIIDSCIILMASPAKDMQLNIHFTPLSTSQDFVSADIVRLKQITLNLISNAVKYNKPGGSIEIALTPQADKTLQLSVTDTGKGIAKKDQAYLFEPFNRLSAKNSNIEGTGIGLLITKRLTEAMYGQLDFDSEIGVGSTFRITLPSTESPHHFSRSVENSDEALLLSPTKKLKILQIEDNPANSSLIEAILQRRDNIQLESCADGPQGIEVAATFKPDLVLLDLNLPTLSGYKVLKELRKMPELSDTPIISISANVLQKDIERIQEAGFDDYLNKPIKIKDLYDKINKFVGDK